MMNDDKIVDTFAARLRETEPTIADGGFTAAVMARSSGLPIWQKNTILLAATALGSAVFAWQVPLTVVPDLLDAVVALWPVALGAGVMLVYGSAVAALWTTRQH